ncbi:MAG: NUDIX domain-containing protein [Dysgonamonadaceae bacterium]|jgi:ADP-ribose pyrophosphatase YjhB (NUDIX family)|nr:NUDIX domain-containing protein [Dysgonamonadaceae bacterium]MDD3355467.1 NUDIX domain-containing protein [Dysgonamonadaceae bacterium]MDD3726775.1 NUDIX domain-containing protein [Dysgonamonadaceae bacterium]MDD4606709.1 NUDIX domain-containing protein [Dysgonamonadaceae bacterium]HUI33393.1 NUDIX domain-containing protein [Dysgonamonadaceae bacterium]
MNHPFSLFKFCPKCGSNEFNVNNKDSKKCNNCGFTYYFNSAAAIVAVIENSKNEILVSRRGKDPAKGTFDLPGGFAARFETIEETVHREVLEETRLEITSVKYLFSIPNIYVYSDFEVHTMDMFFECKIDDFSNIKAQDDVVELLFIPKEELNPDDFGLTSIKKGVEKLQKLTI